MIPPHVAGTRPHVGGLVTVSRHACRTLPWQAGWQPHTLPPGTQRQAGMTPGLAPGPTGAVPVPGAGIDGQHDRRTTPPPEKPSERPIFKGLAAVEAGGAEPLGYASRDEAYCRL